MDSSVRGVACWGDAHLDPSPRHVHVHHAHYDAAPCQQSPRVRRCACSMQHAGQARQELVHLRPAHMPKMARVATLASAGNAAHAQGSPNRDLQHGGTPAVTAHTTVDVAAWRQDVWWGDGSSVWDWRGAEGVRRRQDAGDGVGG